MADDRWPMADPGELIAQRSTTPGTSVIGHRSSAIGHPAILETF
jgi:hypothetical protein